MRQGYAFDALLGIIKNNGIVKELMGALNFKTPFKVTENVEEGSLDVALDWEGAGAEVLIAHDYTIYAHTGTTAETTKVTFANLIKANSFESEPKRLRIVVTGLLVTGAVTTRVGVKLGGVSVDLTQCLGTHAGNSFFEYECIINALAQDSQRERARLDVTGNTPVISSANRTVNTDADASLEVTLQLANAGNTAQIYSVEVYLLG